MHARLQVYIYDRYSSQRYGWAVPEPKLVVHGSGGVGVRSEYKVSCMRQLKDDLIQLIEMETIQYHAFNES